MRKGRTSIKLWLISQEQNNDYDTYNAAVVAAESEDIARQLSPDNGEILTPEDWAKRYSAWCNSPTYVKVEYLGVAKAGTERGLILGSFNAG